MEYEFDELIRPIPDGPDWWSSLRQFPMKIIDQSFGYELDKTDMVNPSKISDVSPWPRTRDRIQNTGYSRVHITDDSFQVELCIKEFNQMDISIDKGFLVIHGEHEEKEEGDGTTIRMFTRRYMLPCDCEQVPIGEKSVSRLEPGGGVQVKIPRVIQKDLKSMDASKDCKKVV